MNDGNIALNVTNIFPPPQLVPLTAQTQTSQAPNLPNVFVEITSSYIFFMWFIGMGLYYLDEYKNNQQVSEKSPELTPEAEKRVNTLNKTLSDLQSRLEKLHEIESSKTTQSWSAWFFQSPREVSSRAKEIKWLLGGVEQELLLLSNSQTTKDIAMVESSKAYYSKRADEFEKNALLGRSISPAAH